MMRRLANFALHTVERTVVTVLSLAMACLGAVVVLVILYLLIVAGGAILEWRWS